MIFPGINLPNFGAPVEITGRLNKLLYQLFQGSIVLPPVSGVDAAGVVCVVFQYAVLLVVIMCVEVSAAVLIVIHRQRVRLSLRTPVHTFAPPFSL